MDRYWKIGNWNRRGARRKKIVASVLYLKKWR